MTKAKHLFIDGQILQTAALKRGMGLYTARFIQALLLSKHGYREVSFVFSNNLPITPDIKKEFSKHKKLKWEFLDLMLVDGKNIDQAFSHNELILSNFINSQQLADVQIDFLIPSLFQEPIAAVFPESANKLLIMYDLIPYLYHHRYEEIWGINFENYLKRFRYLFMADKIFIISHAVAEDLRLYLGVPGNKLAVIDGAAINPHNAPKKPKLNLPDRFILMPTSDDIRKNNQRAVQGFEEFRRFTGQEDYKLVITSSINDNERKRLSAISEHLIFTGNLSDEEIKWLYDGCKAVLFVPEYEGLGLPLLEAVEAGKPVACSSIKTFLEISNDAFHYCDHEDPGSIASAIERATISKPNSSIYNKIAGHYTWSKTAERFLAGRPTKPGSRAVRPKIAIFAPVPGGYSAIGKVVAENHAMLNELFDIDYYLDEGPHKVSTRPNFLQYINNSRPAKTFGAKQYDDYDAVFYHIGNGDYHLETVKTALCLPGYVVLHDTNLEEMYRVMVETKIMTPKRIQLEAALDMETTGSARGITSLVTRQLGVLTHSNFAQSAVVAVAAQLTATSIANLPTSAPTQVNNHTGEPVQVGLAGILAEVKGLDIIDAVASNPKFGKCQIKLFGFNHARQETVDKLNLYHNVSVMSDLSDMEFQQNLSKLHILINVRSKNNGETSLSTLEAMRNGVVVIVKNIGWYAELPDETVIKVNDSEEIFAKLEELLNDANLRKKIGNNAAQYIAKNFSHEQYAQKIKALLGKTNRNSPNYRLAEQLRTGKIRTGAQYIRQLKRIELL